MESNKINLRLISEQEAGLRKKLVWLTAKEANVREKLFMGELLVSFEEAIHELKVEEKEVEGQLKNDAVIPNEFAGENSTTDLVRSRPVSRSSVGVSPMSVRSRLHSSDPLLLRSAHNVSS